MNALGAAVLIIVIVVVLCAPRRWALLGIMAGVLFITQGQQMQVIGFNMFAIRFVELAGFIRVMSRHEFSFSRLNTIDRALLFLYSYTVIVFLLRSSSHQAYQIGVTLDALLCYFAFRGLLRDVEEFIWFLRAFLLLLTPFAVLVLFESLTQNNLFSVMGGLDDSNWIRAGRIRCLGSFRHPSLLGTLGASFLPLYIGLWFGNSDRKLATLGIVLCLLIVWASNSGGPANFAAVGIVGWMLWKLREKMRLVRWIVIIGVVLLTLVMKAPIWYIPAKVSSISGGDGYHRSYLMDIAFQNIDKWGLFGMPITETQGWFPYDLAATGGADMTNQFLSFGMSAGLFSMILFCALIVLAFSKLGKALAVTRLGYHGSKEIGFLLWGLGVMLGGHIFNWLGITYFDQTYVVWFMQFATISSLAETCIQSSQIRYISDQSTNEMCEKPPDLGN